MQNNESQQPVVLDPQFEHFVGGYYNFNMNDRKAEELYAALITATARMVNDLCEYGKPSAVDTKLISELHQHLTSFQFTYERISDCVIKLAKTVQAELKE